MSLRLLFILISTILIPKALSAQTDEVGSGRAIQFDGVDDYIDLGNIYDDLVLPFTVSVWVKIDPTLFPSGPILVSQDNAPLYNGFWFVVSPTHIGVEYGDGMGDNNPAFRRGRSADGIINQAGRWVHMCVVMRSGSDVSLYINGIDVGGNYGGSSTLPMASNFPNDVAKIGYFFSNGTTYRYRGIMDELRVWNRSLSPTEIRESMCKKLTGTEAGLIGYWTFDEVSGDSLKDHSIKHYDGQVKGSPVRVYSGAPIGDESVNLYTSNWTGVTVSLQDGDKVANATNITGNPEGFHIYEVKSLPSQTGGLDLSQITKPYFGFFTASIDNDNHFDIKSSCDVMLRNDNSVSTWTGPSVKASILQRTEMITPPDFSLDLGLDQFVCDKTTVTLNTGLAATNTFLWNTSETTPSIVVSKTDSYSVTVSNACGTKRDTIQVTFIKSPPPFSLGMNQSTCDPHVLLRPLSDTTGFSFTWQDASHRATFLVNDFGDYKVTVWNSCGSRSDSVRISRAPLQPIAIDLGGDQKTCFLSPRKLVPLADSTNFTFTWQDGSHKSTFTVSDYGKYSVNVKNGCIQGQDSIEITKPSLEQLFFPNVITPGNDDYNEFFIVDDLVVGTPLKIYDRWGKLVYESSAYKNDWNARDVAEGIYYLYFLSDCVGKVKVPLSVVR